MSGVEPVRRCMGMEVMSAFDSGVLGYGEILPTEEIEAPIGVGHGRSDIGAADDL